MKLGLAYLERVYSFTVMPSPQNGITSFWRYSLLGWMRKCDWTACDYAASGC